MSKDNADNTGNDQAEDSTVEGEETEEKVTRRLRLGALEIFEIVRREGAEELDRPTSSLWWSGVAAGLALSMSAIMAGVFYAELGDTTAGHMLAPLGYVIGFLIVVFGRLQLFTENTIAAILPLAVDFSMNKIRKVARLYLAVFGANVTGAVLAAAVLVFTPVISGEHFQGVVTISHHAVDQTFWTTFARAIPAGFLVAAMVWMMPSAKGSEFLIVTGIIYVLVLAGFAHVIVGSAEAAVLLMIGEVGLVKALGGFMLPALIGNMIGGTALFAMLAYAQIRNEVASDHDKNKV